MTDAKEMWEAIKSRFGGNDESKKMQEYLLKQQFKSFSVSNSEGLHKGYDKFQSLLSQLETHGAGVSTKDANQKFLRVSESNVKVSNGSSSSLQNVAFASSENTSSTNEFNTAYGGFTSSSHNSQKKGSSSYTDYLIAKLSALIATIQDTLLENADRKGIKTVEEEMQEITDHAEDETEDYALMAYNSSNSGLDTEVTSCLKVREESYAKLKKLYDEQREQLSVASIEIQAYTLALKRSIDVEDGPVNDKFAKVEGMHAVPPPMTGNYMPPKSNFEIDESKFTYETLESVPKPITNDFKVVSKSKVWYDAPIIEEYESDSNDEHVTIPLKEQEKPSFAFVNTVEHIKTPRQTIKEQHSCSQHPKPNNGDWDGLMSKSMGLGYGLLKRLAFVKTASTPIETKKPLLMDEEAVDVDVLGHSKTFTSSSCEEDL
nr:ribonuclease H-like domain-containing protein [Tanacetum cinerariifolium]